MSQTSLSLAEIKRRLAGEGLCLHTGPFVIRAKSNLSTVAEGIHRFYSEYPMHDSDFCDFHIGVHPSSGIRHWIRPQINFELDGQTPFKPMPRNQAFATFEWGFNFCISSYAHQYLIIHAAAVEKDGLAIIMPAQPGSGKSTLTAALVSRGWRLLSDELTLIPVKQGNTIVPITRPINIKNASIQVMQDFAPEQTYGPVVEDTAKGTVAHMKPPLNSIQRIQESAQQHLVIFPNYQQGSDTRLTPRPKARAFMEIAEQSFNISILGTTGFEMLSQTISNCDCYDFSYSRLEEAMSTFDSLIKPQHSIRSLLEENQA